jgi:hypothetical protein
MFNHGLVSLALGGALIAASATAAFSAPAAVSGIATVLPARSPAIERVYWHRHHYYPYYWRGQYYPYRWRGRYYRYFWHKRYYLHRRWYRGRWHYW